MASNAPEFFLDKKWRPSKRDSTTKCSSSSSPLKASLMRSCSQKNTTSKAPSLLRSFSQKTSATSTKLPSLSRTSSISRNSPPPPLKRSSSMKHSPPKSPPLIRSLSKKSSAFTRKCSTLAKEQKARFYIMKRCVTMLVCWRKDRDS